MSGGIASLGGGQAFMLKTAGFDGATHRNANLFMAQTAEIISSRFRVRELQKHFAQNAVESGLFVVRQNLHGFGDDRAAHSQNVAAHLLATRRQM
jgi:hypothetical protein